MLWACVACDACGLRTRGKWCSPGNDCPLFYGEVREEWNRRALAAEAALQANSAAYDELRARVDSAPVGKVEVYDTPEQWTYVIVPQHFQSGQRVRLLLDAHPSDDAGDV